MDNARKLHHINNAIMYFGDTTKKLASVHGTSVIAGLPEISVATKRGIEAMNEVIDSFVGLRDDVLEEIGATKVPIKNMDKTRLKLVTNNGPIEGKTKTIYPKNLLR